MFECT